MAGIARNPDFFPARRVRTRDQPVSKLPSRTGNFTLTRPSFSGSPLFETTPITGPFVAQGSPVPRSPTRSASSRSSGPPSSRIVPTSPGESRCSKPVTFCFADTTPYVSSSSTESPNSSFPRKPMFTVADSTARLARAATPDATDFASFASSTGDPTIRDGFPIFFARSSAESLSEVGFCCAASQPATVTFDGVADASTRPSMATTSTLWRLDVPFRSTRSTWSFFPAVSTHQDSPNR